MLSGILSRTAVGLCGLFLSKRATRACSLYNSAPEPVEGPPLQLHAETQVYPLFLLDRFHPGGLVVVHLVLVLPAEVVRERHIRGAEVKLYFWFQFYKLVRIKFFLIKNLLF